MNIKQIIREEIERVLLEGKIPLRLIQAGAIPNPPKKLYHGSGYKFSYDELNMLEHRTEDGKGFNHTSKGKNVGVYFYEKGGVGFDVKKKIGDIHLIRTEKGSTSVGVAGGSANALNSKFAYVYEAEISDDAKIVNNEKLGAGINPAGINVKQLDSFINKKSKVQLKEFDGAGSGEFVIWNKDVIKSWKIHLIGIENPYYYDTRVPVELAKAGRIWFTDVSKAERFLESLKKDKYGYLKSLITPQEKAA